MCRFICLTFVCLIIGGTLLHYEVYLPYISVWLGKLPGDFILQVNNVTIHFPLVSSALIGVLLSFLIWLISKKKEN